MEINESLQIMKALAVESRLLIIRSLMEKPQYLEELARRINLAESTVSFHMKKLEKAGLVSRMREQYYAMFRINEEYFSRTLEDLLSFDNQVKPQQEARIKSYREKVIDTYFRNGILVKMPAQYKKKMIILQEIIKLFERGQLYPEKEVDRKIEAVYSDYCSIRRYFIDNQMMQRDKGYYNVHPAYVNESPLTAAAFMLKKAVDNEERDNKEEKKVDSRKEMIRKYKETPVPMGIFQVKNLKNGKIFVGSSPNLNARKNREMMMFRLKGHDIKELQEAYNELGENGVLFEVLDYLEPKNDPLIDYKKELLLLEEMWLEKLQPYDEKGYNKRKAAR
ncbi:MAG: DUF2087 domain-containing protein [Syntrophothermus sp.]